MYQGCAKQQRTILCVAEDIDQLLAALTADFSVGIKVDVRPVVVLEDKFCGKAFSTHVTK